MPAPFWSRELKKILPDPLLKGFDAAALGKGGILLVAKRGC